MSLVQRYAPGENVEFVAIDDDEPSKRLVDGSNHGILDITQGIRLDVSDASCPANTVRRKAKENDHAVSPTAAIASRSRQYFVYNYAQSLM